MVYFWTGAILCGLGLQLLVIAALVKGAYRQYRPLLAYAVTLFLATVVDAAAFFQPALYTPTSHYYWIDDAILQILIYVVVISMVRQGMGGARGQRTLQRILIAASIVVPLVSLVAYRDEAFGVWMTKVSRNTGFCAVILNLILWAVLIRSRPLEIRLLMISGGLGIQMAGKAIGHSLREVSNRTVVTGNLVIVLSHLVCLYIWWQALRQRQDVE